MRRRYLVDWKLQGALCLHGLLYGALVLVAVVAGIFVPLLWTLGEGRPQQYEEQAIVMLYMHERLWFLVLVCTGIVLVSAVKMSHRIAGPLVRYKRNLRLVAEGKLPPPLRTRRGDFLQEEVACLNLDVDGVRTRVDAIRSAERRLRAQLTAVAAGAPLAVGARADLDAATAALTAAVAAFAEHDPGDTRPLPLPAAPVVCVGVEGGSA
jgi:hypothetical protein